MLLDFYFQGQVYIIVYVGAIAIQFQFIIMMVDCLGNNTTTKGSYIDSSHNQRQYPTDGHWANGLPSGINNIIGQEVGDSCHNFINKDNLSLFCRNNLISGIAKDNHTCTLDNGYNDAGDAKIINYLFSCPNDAKGIDTSSTNQIGILGDKNILPLSMTPSASNRWSRSLPLAMQPLAIGALYIYLQTSGELGEDTRLPQAIFVNDNIYTISTYFYPVWAIDFISMTDQETQGIMSYIAYPAAQIQIGLTLWAVMIGIISICSPQHR